MYLLSYKSGCNTAINHFLPNIEAMKKVNDDKDNEKCSCVYSNDNSDSDNIEKQSYNSWINSF